MPGHLFNRFTAGKVLIIGTLLIVSGLIGTYVCMRLCLRSNIDEICTEATNRFEGDNVEALLLYLKSDEINLSRKCEIIWALGEIKDRRALSVLKRFDPQIGSDRLRQICQYEVEKAIIKIEAQKRKSQAVGN